ncbi:MAG: flagellar hook-associated protein FlgK [Butyribacter sp.]|nr:flagellar hook-associated protein FlgK [bacterium]MDY3853716.1 flagellar hook-associated protein FlgK [Butyribacter sp.]
MPSSFFGINIARSGMNTYNALLNTTGHNVANVDTKGYSKQVVKQSATQAISLGTSYGMIGSGVEATDVLSERDAYYDEKYRLSNTSYGKYETLSYYMQSIEDYLYAKDSNSGGISNSLDGFFKSLTSLTTDVSNTTIRTQAAGYAETLTQYIQEAAYNLQVLQQDVNSEIANTVDSINSYAEQIASLTKQINTLEVYGTRANDLRDQRATLIDDLSELVSVDVVEKEPAEGKGAVQYIVSINDAVLVDTYDYNRLEYKAKDTYSSMNDIDNLYDLKWSTGQSFGIHDTGLGGKLEALFKLRDGNNGEVFTGAANGSAGDKTLKITDVNELGSSLFKLDIPPADGVIIVNNSRYEYESFDVTVDADGKYSYEFHLKEKLGTDIDGTKAQISESVDYRGIPYYMSQLNEFVRTFSSRFNQVQTSGYDMNGNQGVQMFLGTDKASGVEMNFDSEVSAGFTFSSILPRDAAGNLITTNGYVQTSYYNLTALNTNINKAILDDGKLIACSGSSEEGVVEDGKNLANMLALESDKTMFRQGQPASFLQVLVSTAGVDTEKVKTGAENAENIRAAVDQRRLSKAGVDEDEEAQNLIVCQNLLTYQYKVLSVMNEVLDKLINGTAV